MLLCSHATTPSPAVVFGPTIDSAPHNDTLHSLSCSCYGLGDRRCTIEAAALT